MAFSIPRSITIEIGTSFEILRPLTKEVSKISLEEKYGPLMESYLNGGADNE